MNQPILADGHCHCQAVRFRVTVRDFRALDCNCSICQMLGFQHVIVPQTDFQLLSGRDKLRSYRFNTHVAEHLFCIVCGIKAFYTPRSHPDGVSVNLRCLSRSVRGLFRIRKFDGLNWESNVASIQGPACSFESP